MAISTTHQNGTWNFKKNSNYGDKWKQNFEKVNIRWMSMLEPLKRIMA